MDDPEDEAQTSEEMEVEAPESAPEEARAVVPPLTTQEFSERFHTLIERGKAAKARPFQAMASAVFSEVFNLSEGILRLFEGDDKKKKE